MKLDERDEYIDAAKEFGLTKCPGNHHNSFLLIKKDEKEAEVVLDILEERTGKPRLFIHPMPLITGNLHWNEATKKERELYFPPHKKARTRFFNLVPMFPSSKKDNDGTVLSLPDPKISLELRNSIQTFLFSEGWRSIEERTPPNKYKTGEVILARSGRTINPEWLPMYYIASYSSDEWHKYTRHLCWTFDGRNRIHETIHKYETTPVVNLLRKDLS